MKKFYESPIVEFTVFDVEDVITTSATTIDTLHTDMDLDALVEEINDSTAPISAAKYNGSTYSW